MSGCTARRGSTSGHQTTTFAAVARRTSLTCVPYRVHTLVRDDEDCLGHQDLEAQCGGRRGQHALGGGVLVASSHQLQRAESRPLHVSAFLYGCEPWHVAPRTCDTVQRFRITARHCNISHVLQASRRKLTMADAAKKNTIMVTPDTTMWMRCGVAMQPVCTSK